MMMIGEPTRFHPTIQIPPWDPYEEISSPISHITSPYPVSGVSSVAFNGNATSPNGDHNNPFTLNEAFSALSRFLPSNEFASEADLFGDDSDLPFDSFSCDNFRMYDFKVRRCARGRSHDWTECPYAHPGEKARRRDPRKCSYSGTACPEFRKGSCLKGDACEFAHGVFECWLHPDRYRTQACKDGMDCRRRVCFFAHSPEQLRVVSLPSPKSRWNELSFDGYDGSPIRRNTFDAYLSSVSTFQSPPSSPPSASPPHSPATGSYNSMSELVSSMRSLQLGKAKASTSPSAASWGGGVPSCFGSPRGTASNRHGFYSQPTTPTRVPTRSGLGCHELWDNNICEEEPAMERVESGRDLRARIYAKLSRENSLGRHAGAASSVSAGPDVGWISDLVK